MMRRVLASVLVVFGAACQAPASGPYIFLWAGDADDKASDFLAVIDADTASKTYGTVLASLPTGMAGAHPHHTEQEMPANGHLLANGFHAGRTWLFDLTAPRTPKILASIGDVGGYSHPHTFVRMADGTVLTTFQYLMQGADMAADSGHTMAMAAGGTHLTGGLVLMDERGTLIRGGSAADTTIPDRRIYPYSVLPLPGSDRAVSTTTDMDHADTVGTFQWIQFWKLSDLSLRRTIALPPGPRGTEQHYTGEPRLLPDGKSIYIHTFACGLYLLRGAETDTPVVQLVHAFEGEGCGVPLLAGHFWLQPVPDAHALVSMDITDAEHPREVSRVTFGDQEAPHWIALDPAGRRIVLNSGGSVGNRLFVINLDPATGALAIDQRFRDAGSTQPGLALTGKTWPHGFTGTARPHGTVFSR